MLSAALGATDSPGRMHQDYISSAPGWSEALADDLAEPKPERAATTGPC